MTSQLAHELRADRRAGLRAVFPHRAQHRPLRPLARHPVPGPRVGAPTRAVCFVLGITSIDPARSDLLFERFVSAERNEPPDIDVDFEHERREEVIQWIYDTYGRDRAALCATVIRYRGRGAVRDVGKAMGLTEDVTGALASQVWGWSEEGVAEEHAAALNLNLQDRRLRLTLDLARELIGFPRHLSQHPGGFVLTQDRLDDLVPIEPAAMADRQVIEWDKDDIDTLRFMKVDVLGLGMLGCMRRAFDLLAEHKRHATRSGDDPAEDPATYAMIRKADTLGTFQIEIRAQMSMLPRLKPRTFYDIVIQVAIVRPGPIQGDMVHPYLRRREGLEKVEYPDAGTARACWKKPWACRCSRNRRCRSPSSAPASRRARPTRSAAAWRRSSSPAVSRISSEKLIDGMVERRLYSRVRREDVLADRGVRQLRISRKPCSEFRADRVCLGLAEVPPPGRVLLRAAERAADGILRAGADRPRRPAARGEVRPVSVNQSAVGLHVGVRPG